MRQKKRLRTIDFQTQIHGRLGWLGVGQGFFYMTGKRLKKKKRREVTPGGPRSGGEVHKKKTVSIYGPGPFKGHLET